MHKEGSGNGHASGRRNPDESLYNSGVDAHVTWTRNVSNGGTKNCGLLVVRINRISLVTDPAESPLESPRPPLVARVSVAPWRSVGRLAASPHHPSEPTHDHFDLSPKKINGPSSNSRDACQFRHQGMVIARCSPTVSWANNSHAGM